MQKFLVVGMILMLSLAGCATARKAQNTEVQDLQEKVVMLQSDLDRVNQQVEGLQEELAQTRRPAVVGNVPVTTSKNIRVPGVSVADVQGALKAAGFYDGNVDGKFGPKTKEAIKSFQTSKEIKSDGVVGAKTWSLLNSQEQ